MDESRTEMEIWIEVRPFSAILVSFRLLVVAVHLRQVSRCVKRNSYAISSPSPASLRMCSLPFSLTITHSNFISLIFFFTLFPSLLLFLFHSYPLSFSFFSFFSLFLLLCIFISLFVHLFLTVCPTKNETRTRIRKIDYKSCRSRCARAFRSIKK